MSETTGRLDKPEERTLFGHPIGLANLFGVELWERFSFYGMLLILNFYLYYEVTRGGLGLPETTANSIVGAYGGFVYLCTVLGGWLADRALGMERMIFYGGFVVMLGHLALAVLPGLAGVGLGLVLVGLGSGALKANASALLGQLYRRGDVRRDGGFTLFYMGINVGSFIGPILTGLVQETHGFHWGFGLAAFGMALGLTQYVRFRRNFGDAGREPGNPLPSAQLPKAGLVAAGVLLVVVAVLVSGWVTLANLAKVIALVGAVVAIGYFVMLLTSGRVTPEERTRVRAFIPLFLATTAFFALFQQTFTVLAQYSDTRIDWNIFGWQAPPSWIGSEPVWVIVLAPLFARLWTGLGNRGPSTPVKFGIAVIGMGGAFLLFLPMAVGSGKTSPALAVFGILGLFAVFELMLSPIGLSAATRLAPAQFRAQMMALYFLSLSLATALSGVVSDFYVQGHEFGYFAVSGAVAIGLGLLVLAASPWVKRRMAGGL